MASPYGPRPGRRAFVIAVIAVSLAAGLLPTLAPPASAVTEYRYEVVPAPPSPLDYRAVAWASDGSEAMIVGGIQALLRYDPVTGRALGVGDGNWSTASQMLEDVAHSASGRIYISGGRLEDSSIKGDLWQLTGDTVQLSGTVDGDILEAVAVSPGGRVIVAGTLGSVLELRNGTLVSLGSAGDIVLHDAAWAPDGSGALLVGAAGTITWFDAGTGELLPVPFTSTHPLYSVSWHPSSAFAWAVGEGGLVVEVNSTDLVASRVRPYSPRDLDLLGVSWHPNGDLALVVGEEGQTYLYRFGVFTTQLVDVNVDLLDVMWNPEGDEALVVGASGTVLRYAPRINPQNRAPDAVISSPSDGHQVEADVKIAFDGSSSSDPDGDPLVFTWTSNRTGVIGTGERVEESLPIGEHRVTLHVDDGQGHNSTDTVAVRVVKPVPAVDRLHLNIVTPRPNALIGGQVTISGTASFELGGIASVEMALDGGGWRPVEGTTTWSAVLDTTILEDGIHSIVVKVTADDEVGTSRVGSVLVEVRNTVVPEPPGVPNITLNMRDHGRVHELISFSADGEDLSSWLLVWRFGDGSGGQGTMVRHAYSEEGIYQVTLELWLEGYDEPAAVFTTTLVIEDEPSAPMSVETLVAVTLVVAGTIYVAGYYGGRRAFRRD